MTPPMGRKRKPAPPSPTSVPPHQPTEPDPSDGERLPPNSNEAERGVLGCILLEPSEVIPKCIEVFKAGSDVFYDIRHRSIYDKCIWMWDTDRPIDSITLHQSLKDSGLLEASGGLAYLAELPDTVPSAANIDHYTEIVLKKFLLRQLITAAIDIRTQAIAEPEDVHTVLALASSAVDAVADQGTGKVVTSTMKMLIPAAMQHIDMLHSNAGKVTGLPTGLSDLDMLTWGLHPSEMVVLAARPGMGKTSLAMNIVEYVALHEQLPVAVFSMEMSAESLMVRMLCSRAHVSSSSLRTGYATEGNIAALVSASVAFNKAPVLVDDTSALSVLQLRARARALHKQHGVRLIVVDYLQLMNAPMRRSDNRQQEVSNISGGLKALAKDLNIPVLVLSQLNRKLDDRSANALPKISDLRESGSIEQDADMVILLHRPVQEKKDQVGTYIDVVPVTAIVGKNRNGPTGEVELVFLRGCTRFESKAKHVAPDNDQEAQPELPV
jgi:replicative DNA helicase